MFRKHPHFFQDPHIDYSIDHFDMGFADYITKIKKIITQYHYGLDLASYPEKVIEAVAPFELLPEKPIFSEKNSQQIKYGVLLIHGLFDSPFSLRDIGKYLQSLGILARSIVLPGHCSVPGSLLHVTYDDWLQTVRYGIASLEKEVEKIYLVGFSTGATLSIYHALKNPDHIAGIIGLSPALKINSYFTPLSGWIYKHVDWMNKVDEIDYTKYGSVPYNVVHQLHQLIKKINHSKKLTCPLFMGLSEDDLIVASSASIRFFRQHQNPKNKMILYTSRKNDHPDSRIIARSSVYPEWHIASFSHVSIPISPDNPHYGIKGDYPLASRVDQKNNYIYGELDRPHQLYYDGLYQLKLTKYQHQRLTFNPDFDFLAKQMGEFIFSSAPTSSQPPTKMHRHK